MEKATNIGLITVFERTEPRIFKNEQLAEAHLEADKLLSNTAQCLKSIAALHLRPEVADTQLLHLRKSRVEQIQTWIAWRRCDLM